MIDVRRRLQNSFSRPIVGVENMTVLGPTSC
jgi:hypothetical protein